jgi:hypothetical protein
VCDQKRTVSQAYEPKLSQEDRLREFHWLEAVHSDDIEATIKTMKHALRTGVPSESHIACLASMERGDGCGRPDLRVFQPMGKLPAGMEVWKTLLAKNGQRGLLEEESTEFS